jgi:hypothetical protein
LGKEIPSGSPLIKGGIKKGDFYFFIFQIVCFNKFPINKKNGEKIFSGDFFILTFFSVKKIKTNFMEETI